MLDVVLGGGTEASEPVRQCNWSVGAFILVYILVQEETDSKQTDA